ncbi:MAG: anaerobic ribonucleoside-triphosphate reductase activating protein [Ruminococcaceae bacterium]|nr:anaerobic ribonucleoside-triphosphate reductase activating protein [Oscillospiraceae bacterium]
MNIKGLQKTTLLDFPGKVACTVFTGGCNFRCPFCHNASLVTHQEDAPVFSEKEVLSYIEKRKNILDGVCITGGEPLLQTDIEAFCQSVHNFGLLVKLDTNGALSERLNRILEKKLVDYVAMDIKNSKEEYARTCGLPSFPSGVEDSVERLLHADIPYEFRTTVVREFHTEESIEALVKWIKGAKQYFLQGFTDSGDLIAEGLSAYSAEEMNTLLSVARRYIPHTELRGI